MPQVDSSAYEYQPEEAITKAQYESVCREIEKVMEEDISKEHIDCDNGACPVDFKEVEELAETNA